MLCCARYRFHSISLCVCLLFFCILYAIFGSSKTFSSKFIKFMLFIRDSMISIECVSILMRLYAFFFNGNHDHKTSPSKIHSITSEMQTHIERKSERTSEKRQRNKIKTDFSLKQNACRKFQTPLRIAQTLRWNTYAIGNTRKKEKKKINRLCCTHTHLE